MMRLDANALQTNINDKYKKKKTFDTLNHDQKVLGVDHDFSSTTNPQESHKRKSRLNVVAQHLRVPTSEMLAN